MWFLNKEGKREFNGGKQDWTAAASEAAKCRNFQLDVDEEIVADETVSCYNCRLRRWTMRSFVCCAQK
ncbi:hypothetical protein SPSIL_041010 [Sporomusa silvacetica DSM 10669]|uniref:Uncharacterized protein n=1 Tax=Sporomusa silvacetica DSM 10669 TaxID=1123289 RepID=A0ABZ3IQC5_9FIRM|nr:hypothetical protein [Sporomusa silvacetica]OZC22867.1 hypothetical protein SPSIL_04400 [Sporomusa silvacetica DSM 10669]